MGSTSRSNLKRLSLSTSTAAISVTISIKANLFAYQRFGKGHALRFGMNDGEGGEENPFVKDRKKLVEEARRISEELEENEARAREQAKVELERELMEAKKALIDDIQTALAKLLPLQINEAGSTVITSEAFAWFYDESEPLVVLNRPSYASGSDDETIKLWNANKGECLATLEGHGSPVMLVAFSPDGTTLASGSGDKTIKLWNANTGECLRTLDGHTNSVYSVAFSAGGLGSFSRPDVHRIFNEVRDMLLEAEYGLSTEDGIEFTVSWDGLK